MAEGVIFTNLQALARKFGTDAAAVRKLLAAMPKHRRHTASVTASSMPATMFFATPRPGATAP